MPSGVSFHNRIQAEGVRLQLNLLDERRYQSMERNTTHQNAYTGYDVVEDTIEEFKDCLRYIASLPGDLDEFESEDDNYKVDYESALDDLWEIIHFMFTDETFTTLFSENIYEFIDHTLEAEGLFLQNDYHRVFDKFRRDRL